MIFRGFFRPLATVLALLPALFAVQNVAAEQDYIGLRSGPSPAFPVIFEVTGEREMRPLQRRGSWLKMTDERNEGWLHVDDLHRVRSLPADEMWALINQARPGNTRLEFGLVTQSAWSIGLLTPVYGLPLYFRHTRNPDGDQNWGLTEVGYIKRSRDNSGGVALNVDLGLGLASQTEGSNYWSDSSSSVPVLSGGAEAAWSPERYFEIGVRGHIAVTLDSEPGIRPGASLIWRIRL